MSEVFFDHGSWSVRRWTTPMWAANVYLVMPVNSDEALLVDAGGKAKEIKKYLMEKNKQLKYIVLTHKHGDHTGAVRRIRRFSGAQVMAGKDDIRSSKFYTKGWKILSDGGVLSIGDIKAKVLATPGHTRGGISLLLPGAVFTGDTLFAGSIGRTDLSGGSLEDIYRSITQKLLTLPDNTVVYPGHGPPSTIGKEKVSNPFLTGKMNSGG